MLSAVGGAEESPMFNLCDAPGLVMSLGDGRV